MTESEELFERFCSENSISCERVAEEKQRTPDYDLLLSDNTIVTEIKQFDPSDEELEYVKKLDAGEIATIGMEPGDRVRKKIDSAKGQLRRRAKGKHPTLLVLYNNVGFLPDLLSSYSIKVGMYGLEVVAVRIPAASIQPPKIVDCRFGPKRRVTPTDNTTLSAVAALYETTDKLLLYLYHNIYAAIPLSPDWLRIPDVVRHFRLQDKTKGSFQEWSEI